MSYLEMMHTAHKARLSRIAARAVPDDGIDLWRGRGRPAGSVKEPPLPELPIVVAPPPVKVEEEVPPAQKRRLTKKVRASDGEAIDSSPSETPFSTILPIQHAVCCYFNISRKDLISNRRYKEFVIPRQISMYLYKALKDFSYPEVARKHGGRDHTTALHAIRKIAKLREQGDQSTCDAISAISLTLADDGIDISRLQIAAPFLDLTRVSNSAQPERGYPAPSIPPTVLGCDNPIAEHTAEEGAAT